MENVLGIKHILTNVRKCKIFFESETLWELSSHEKFKVLGQKCKWQMMSKFKSPQYTIRKVLKNKY
jgi:hypothetical protein